MQAKNRGVSLIELLVAVAILMLGAVPMIRVIMYGLEVTNRAHKTTLATNLAREMAEEIRSQAFSEEYVYLSRDGSCDIETRYPESLTVAQCFGLESGESSDTAANEGRIAVFDDIDDYNGWCRGEECEGTASIPLNGGPQSALEDYDGTQHGSDSLWFTRRVRIHNLTVANQEISSFYKDPFPLYTSTDNRQDIKRYNFENWSSLTRFDDGSSATGLTWLKRIEVRVTYNGPSVKGIEVLEVSHAVMPRALL